MPRTVWPNGSDSPVCRTATDRPKGGSIRQNAGTGKGMLYPLLASLKVHHRQVGRSRTKRIKTMYEQLSFIPEVPLKPSPEVFIGLPMKNGRDFAITEKLVQ